MSPYATVLTALALGNRSAPQFLWTAAAVALFVAHEPLLILAGERGRRSHSELGEQAQKLAASLDQDFPLDTLVQGYWLPSIRAALELNRRNAGQALQLLQAAAPYELGQNLTAAAIGMLYPVFLRAQAYLLAGRGKEAAAEFQKILDHRGIVINSPSAALARLGDLDGAPLLCSVLSGEGIDELRRILLALERGAAGANPR